jgi:hypothetical protein
LLLFGWALEYDKLNAVMDVERMGDLRGYHFVGAQQFVVSRRLNARDAYIAPAEGFLIYDLNCDCHGCSFPPLR